MANLIPEQDIFFTAFEPKVQNRFRVIIDGIPPFMARDVARPRMKQDVVKLNHINTQRYVKGRTIWETVDMQLFDPIVPSGTQAVMEWQRLHHESVTGRDGYAEFYKKDIILQTLGPVGDIAEEWILRGCQIVNLDFGKMSYDSDAELAIIKLTIQPDFCINNF